jgi:hypothetical protein
VSRFCRRKKSAVGSKDFRAGKSNRGVSRRWRSRRWTDGRFEDWEVCYQSRAWCHLLIVDWNSWYRYGNFLGLFAVSREVIIFVIPTIFLWFGDSKYKARARGRRWSSWMRQRNLPKSSRRSVRCWRILPLPLKLRRDTRVRFPISAVTDFFRCQPVMRWYGVCGFVIVRELSRWGLKLLESIQQSRKTNWMLGGISQYWGEGKTPTYDSQGPVAVSPLVTQSPASLLSLLYGPKRWISRYIRSRDLNVAIAERTCKAAKLRLCHFNGGGHHFICWPLFNQYFPFGPTYYSKISFSISSTMWSSFAACEVMLKKKLYERGWLEISLKGHAYFLGACWLFIRR